MQVGILFAFAASLAFPLHMAAQTDTTQPWPGKKIFVRAPADFEIMDEVQCKEWLQMGGP